MKIEWNTICTSLSEVFNEFLLKVSDLMFICCRIVLVHLESGSK